MPLCAATATFVISIKFTLLVLLISTGMGVKERNLSAVSWKGLEKDNGYQDVTAATLNLTGDNLPFTTHSTDFTSFMLVNQGNI